MPLDVPFPMESASLPLHPTALPVRNIGTASTVPESDANFVQTVKHEVADLITGLRSCPLRHHVW